MRETKRELKARMRRQGCSREFFARREELKLQGVPAREAWDLAALDFPPNPTAPPSGSGGSRRGAPAPAAIDAERLNQVEGDHLPGAEGAAHDQPRRPRREALPSWEDEPGEDCGEEVGEDCDEDLWDDCDDEP
jgi:hypothetical protein